MAPARQQPASIATASVVLGAVGFVVGICSIIGLILGLVAHGKAKRGEISPARIKAGIVVSIISLVLGAIGWIILFAAIAAGSDTPTATTVAAPPAVTSEAPAAPTSSGADPAETVTPTKSEEVAVPAPPAPAEPAVVISAQEMIDALEGNALNAKRTYEDKRVTVSGFVGNIDASGNYFALDPEPDAFILTGVQVQIDEKFLDQVSGFTEGQAVTVTGTVTSVGEVLGYSIEAETIG